MVRTRIIVRVKRGYEPRVDDEAGDRHEPRWGRVVVSRIKMNRFVSEHAYAIGFRFRLLAYGLLGLE